jgi:hypothetical protein
VAIVVATGETGYRAPKVQMTTGFRDQAAQFFSSALSATLPHVVELDLSEYYGEEQFVVKEV